MNKPMATFKHTGTDIELGPNILREQEEHDIECDKYQADIVQRTVEYMATPRTLIIDQYEDGIIYFVPWLNETSFDEAVRTSDFAEMGRQLFLRIFEMANQQATEDVEKGYE